MNNDKPSDDDDPLVYEEVMELISKIFWIIVVFITILHFL